MWVKLYFSSSFVLRLSHFLRQLRYVHHVSFSLFIKQFTQNVFIVNVYLHENNNKRFELNVMLLILMIKPTVNCSNANTEQTNAHFSLAFCLLADLGRVFVDFLFVFVFLALNYLNWTWQIFNWSINGLLLQLAWRHTRQDSNRKMLVTLDVEKWMICRAKHLI